MEKAWIIFWIRIFPYSGIMQWFPLQISVFTPSTGKKGPEETPYWGAFYAIEHLYFNALALPKTISNKFSETFRTEWVRVFEIFLQSLFSMKISINWFRGYIKKSAQVLFWKSWTKRKFTIFNWKFGCWWWFWWCYKEMFAVSKKSVTIFRTWKNK